MFTNNSGTLMTVFIATYLVKFIFVFLSLIACKDSKLSNVVIWLNNKLNMLVFINLVYAFELDFVLSSIIGLTNNLDGFWINFIGKSIAATCLASFIILLLFIIIKVWRLRQRPKENEYWAFLKEDLKKNANIIAQFLEEIIAIRDLFIPFIVILFYEVPLLQIGATLTAMLVCLLFRIIGRPSSSCLENLL